MEELDVYVVHEQYSGSESKWHKILLRIVAMSECTRQKCLIILTALCCVLWLDSCRFFESGIPPGVDAVVNVDLREERDLELKYDALIMVSVESISEYSSSRWGNWVTTWYVCTATVSRVLKGDLEQGVIKIAYSQKLPTPESGIVLDLALPTYRQGAILALGLRMAKRPFEVVFDQERVSRQRYGKPTDWLSLDENVNLRITQAAEHFLGFRPSTLILEGQTDEAYIISDYSRMISVDKKTFNATSFTER